MLKYVFVISFLVSCLFQKVGWIDFDMVDGDLWASQAIWVQTGDHREFDMLAAYGHPGGPIIDGTTAIHEASGLSYMDSLKVFLIFFDSLIIAFICTICYSLRKDHYWWIIALTTLSLSRFYDSLTPPSAVAALLLVLLSLVSLFIYEKKSNRDILALSSWSVIGGLMVATRADVGTISLLAFAILLWRVVGWKKVIYMLAGAFATFWFFDPFMWFMPLQHVKDLIYKVTYHYADFAPAHISTFSLFSVSCFAFVSIFLALAFIFMRKKIKQPLPTAYVYTILILTLFLYVIFLTAHYQASRYFVPIVFIWEVFLPLFLFGFIPYIRFDFLKSSQSVIRAQNIVKIIVTGFLAGYNIIFFAISLSIYCQCWN